MGAVSDDRLIPLMMMEWTRNGRRARVEESRARRCWCTRGRVRPPRDAMTGRREKMWVETPTQDGRKSGLVAIRKKKGGGRNTRGKKERAQPQAKPAWKVGKTGVDECEREEVREVTMHTRSECKVQPFCHQLVTTSAAAAAADQGTVRRLARRGGRRLDLKGREAAEKE